MPNDEDTHESNVDLRERRDDDTLRERAVPEDVTDANEAMNEQTRGESPREGAADVAEQAPAAATGKEYLPNRDKTSDL